MTPMMQQYFEIKNQYRDYILFYRLGDFYEMFFEDAQLVSAELDLTLTGRDCGEDERAPMCGVPYHSSETYIGKLIEKGYKVAICEQVEDPKSAKNLVKREVVRIITPGTLIETELLSDKNNNYFSTIYHDGDIIGICFADISTAFITATSFRDRASEDAIVNELSTYAPGKSSPIPPQKPSPKLRIMSETSWKPSFPNPQPITSTLTTASRVPKSSSGWIPSQVSPEPPSSPWVRH